MLPDGYYNNICFYVDFIRFQLPNNIFFAKFDCFSIYFFSYYFNRSNSFAISEFPLSICKAFVRSSRAPSKSPISVNATALLWSIFAFLSFSLKITPAYFMHNSYSLFFKWTNVKFDISYKFKSASRKPESLLSKRIPALYSFAAFGNELLLMLLFPAIFN
jgi:hypothetical protein